MTCLRARLDIRRCGAPVSGGCSMHRARMELRRLDQTDGEPDCKYRGERA